MNSPVDRTRLEQVLRANPPHTRNAFLSDLCRSIAADAQLLVAAVAAEDHSRTAQLAHRIEGAARVIGAGQLADACHAISRVVASRQRGALLPALASLLESKETLIAFVEAQVPVPAPAAATREPAQLCEGLRFLILEENDFQRGMMVGLLRRLGAPAVHEFVDGASAVAAARAASAAELLLFDAALPAAGGAEVMRSAGLQSLPPALVIVSAAPDEALSLPVQTARASGANVLGAVSKPLTASKLAPLLRQHRHQLRQLPGEGGAGGCPDRASPRKSGCPGPGQSAASPRDAV